MNREARQSSKIPRALKYFNFTVQVLFILAFLIGISAWAGVKDLKGNDSQLVPMVPDKVYVPIGFDTNDPTIEFVIEGDMPNSCYDVGPIDYQVKNGKIYVQNYAIYRNDQLCMQMQVNYDRTIRLKNYKNSFQPGNYEIIAKANRTKTLGAVPITKPKNKKGPKGTDNYLYAPVQEAYVRLENQVPTLVMRGRYPNSCMNIKKIKVKRQHDGEVLVVQPIAEMKQNDCPDSQEYPFEVHKPLRKLPKEGKTLVHIRALNGEAVNTFVNLKDLF